ncbi:hypothetical protein [Caballeronia sp. GAWG1-5s-s]|uniref:hypothetical protein n=1 Tax=Caballeronia sp. GAWG1-5s-s TaxID=2921743 RepID=UPI0025423E2F|nr:hypothetical protein [Caballeronia sp. GAWG1-5s-s]
MAGERRDGSPVRPARGGKNHLGSAVGHPLIDVGYGVLFPRTSELVQKLQAKLHRFALIILDDLS